LLKNLKLNNYGCNSKEMKWFVIYIQSNAYEDGIKHFLIKSFVSLIILQLFFVRRTLMLAGSKVNAEKVKLIGFI